MAAQAGDPVARGASRRGGHTSAIPHQTPPGGTGSVEAAARGVSPVKRFLKILGPGFITGASDDDPSGIGTYAQAGAQFGFGMLWMALVSFPLMATVQFICAKVGMVSGMGLAGVLRRHYPRWVLYLSVVLLVVANTINVGADIGAIAAAVNLLLPMPIWLLILPVTAAILALMIWGSYRLIARVFKWLTLALLAYIASAVFSHPDWGAVLHGTLVPTFSLDAGFLTVLVATLGTTISPYLFFWQATQEVEEEVSIGRTRLWQRRGASDKELKYAAWDVNIGMFFSNLVMYFIILATGATLHAAGKTDIQSATDAAQALRPVAGEAAYVLLAVGLIGAGFLAVPILAGCGAYALSEAFGWKYGLDARPGRAKQFYAVIAASMLVGMLIDFVGINPISALVWTAVINGLLAPPLLVMIMLVANNKAIMGERVNNGWTNVLGWLCAAAMTAAAAALALTWGR